LFGASVLILFCVICWATDLHMTRSLKEIVTPIVTAA